LVAQLVHLFALLLWAGAALALIGGMPELTVAIVVVILANAVFAFVQEDRQSVRRRRCAGCFRTRRGSFVRVRWWRFLRRSSCRRRSRSGRVTG
jgi:hypothetical protein